MQIGLTFFSVALREFTFTSYEASASLIRVRLNPHFESQPDSWITSTPMLQPQTLLLYGLWGLQHPTSGLLNPEPERTPMPVMQRCRMFGVLSDINSLHFCF